MTITITAGDCRDLMAAMPANRVGAIVTDPPYGLSAASGERAANRLARILSQIGLPDLDQLEPGLAQMIDLASVRLDGSELCRRQLCALRVRARVGMPEGPVDLDDGATIAQEEVDARDEPPTSTAESDLAIMGDAEGGEFLGDYVLDLRDAGDLPGGDGQGGGLCQASPGGVAVLVAAALLPGRRCPLAVRLLGSTADIGDPVAVDDNTRKASGRARSGDAPTRAVAGAVLRLDLVRATLKLDTAVTTLDGNPLALRSCAQLVRTRPRAGLLSSVAQAYPVRLVGPTADGAGAWFRLWLAPGAFARLDGVKAGGGFMGEEWDHDVPGPEFWRHALRVAKPGCHLAAFGGTRKWHRLACAIEDAGWEIRDSLIWLYGSGMPHGVDVSKELDRRRDRSERSAILEFCRRVRAARDAVGKTNREIDGLFGFKGMAGHWCSAASQPLIPTIEQWPILAAFLGIDGEELQVLSAEAWRLNGRKGQPGPDWYKRAVLGVVEVSINPGFAGARHVDGGKPGRKQYKITAPASEAAKIWEGWTTTLKPGWEPIILARKPLEGTVGQNTIAWGVGGMNTGRCALGGDTDQERHPANVLLDEEAAAILDAEVGLRRSGGIAAHHVASGTSRIGTFEAGGERVGMVYPAGLNPISRYYFTAKANRRERDLGAVENTHPTVKPVALMRWLVELLTPPGEVVFDPFAGSGTTMVAAALSGFEGEACDIDPEYAELSRRRVEACGHEVDDEDIVRPVLAVEPVQRSLW